MTELAVGTEVTPSIRLKRPLGAGGMGSVWVADHAALRTEVVVKFLADRLAEDPTSQARFAREASAAAQVKSPHVVQMLDHGVMDGGHPFIVMELLDGRDLAQELRRRVLAPHEVAHVVEHIALALGRAHSRGIVHRDIKPNNIFLCDVGTSSPFVKLLDFGIAREGDQNLTTTGHLVGTPAYMSPEQLSGRPVEAQSDLWSLAVVALKALTGKNPYERPTMPETIGAVVHGDIPVPSALCAGLPAGVDAWFARACARDPTRRFGSSNALAEALWEAIGMPKTVVSSPSASGAPLPVPVPAASTVSITPSEPITEGTLRSVGGRVPPSLTPEPVAAQASRAPIALVGIAALALVAGLSFALGSVTTPAVPRLASTLRPIAARAAEFASKARREPPPSEGVSPVAPSATEKPSPKKPVAGKPKPKDDDDLGF